MTAATSLDSFQITEKGVFLDLSVTFHLPPAHESTHLRFGHDAVFLCRALALAPLAKMGGKIRLDKLDGRSPKHLV